MPSPSISSTSLYVSTIVPNRLIVSPSTTVWFKPISISFIAAIDIVGIVFCSSLCFYFWDLEPILLVLPPLKNNANRFKQNEI